VRDFFEGRVARDKADVGMDPVRVSLRFEAFPAARKELPARAQPSGRAQQAGSARRASK
jgi:hypothetical protein